MEKIAMCGLDCASCSAYIATRNDDSKLREKTASEWNKRYKERGCKRPALRPGNINCSGCLSKAGTLFLHCRICQVRKCGLEKGIRNCGECKEYGCLKIEKLHERTTAGKEACDRIKAKHLKAWPPI